MPPARRTPSSPATVLKISEETLHVGEPSPEVPSTEALALTPPQSVEAGSAHPAAAPAASDVVQRVNIAKTLRFYADTERRMVTVTALGAITPGLPSTITEFTNAAFDLYLQKLADEFNDGQPFAQAPSGTRATTGPRPR